jgi:hypothetical protein
MFDDNVVECEVEECEIENGEGRDVPGVRAICGECRHECEAFGTGEKSVRRALAMLRDECPQGESNFYVDENE